MSEKLKIELKELIDRELIEAEREIKELD